MTSKIILSLLILLALGLRLFPLSFPNFTEDESKIATTDSIIAQTGQSEWGSYQLPIASYLVALSELILGKNDLAIRLPFVLVGTLLVWLVFWMTKILSYGNKTALFSCFFATTSPVLIFLSKIPNPTILLIFGFCLLLILLVKLRLKTYYLVAVAALFSLVSFGLFFYSANSSLFSSLTVSNGINTLRGQGLQSGWPFFLERLLFNKAHFLLTGLLHWLSNLSPAIYFGRFDESGLMNFSSLGAFAKAAIVPFILGIIYLVKAGKQKERVILLLILALTWPAFLVYPNYSLQLVAITVPLVCLILAGGAAHLNKQAALVIGVLILVEVLVSLIYISPEQKNTQEIRPTQTKLTR